MAISHTYLSDFDVNAVVKFCGCQIREFLDFLQTENNEFPFSQVIDNRKFFNELEPEYSAVLESYKASPESFSDQELIKRGADFQKAINNVVRIEVRKTEGVPGAAQIAVKGIKGDCRKVCLERFQSQDNFKDKNIEFRMAGVSTFEVNVSGVNKALPLKYLRDNFSSLLQQMGYTAGDYIDSSQTQTCIAADGDGTTYGKPRIGYAPVLEESETFAALIQYLGIGGVYMIISGNDLNRTESRLKSIPKELRQRVLVSANGGADLACYSRSGHLVDMDDYWNKAIDCLNSGQNQQSLDALYIGDDGTLNGNDYVAFKEIGFERSFVVAVDDEGIAEELKTQFVGDCEAGTERILAAVIDIAQRNKNKRIFDKENLLAIVEWLNLDKKEAWYAGLNIMLYQARW